MRLQKAAAGLLAFAVLSGCAAGGVPAIAPDEVTARSEAADSSSEAADAPQAPLRTDPNDDREYRVTLNQSRTLVMDASGNRLSEGALTLEERERPLKDLLTGETRYLTRQKQEDTGVRDEYGHPITRWISALYTPDGELLEDWAEWEYTNAVGDLILRTNRSRRGMDDLFEPPAGYRSELWNRVTDEVLLADVDEIEAFDGTTVLARNLFYQRRNVIGLLDGQGTLVRSFPTDLGEISYVRYVKGHTLVETEDGAISRAYLLDEQFETLFAADRISVEYNSDDAYLTYRKIGVPDEYGFIRADTGEVVVSVTGRELQLNTFDGERMILTESREVGYLCDAQGQKLTEGYHSLSPALTTGQKKQNEPARFYYGLRDGKCEKLDRDGNVVASIETTAANWVNVDEGGFVRIGYNLNDQSTEQVTDLDLNPIIEPGQYRWVMPMSEWEQEERIDYDLLQAYQSDPSDRINHYVILRPDGTVVMDKISETGTVGPNRIAVRRGFKAGLIDWEGNWIAQYSIFDGVNDDYNPWGIW